MEQNKRCQSIENINSIRQQLFSPSSFGERIQTRWSSNLFTWRRLYSRASIESVCFSMDPAWIIAVLWTTSMLDSSITHEYTKRCVEHMKYTDCTFESANVDYRSIDRLLYWRGANQTQRTTRILQKTYRASIQCSAISRSHPKTSKLMLIANAVFSFTSISRYWLTSHVTILIPLTCRLSGDSFPRNVSFVFLRACGQNRFF